MAPEAVFSKGGTCSPTVSMKSVVLATIYNERDIGYFLQVDMDEIVFVKMDGMIDNFIVTLMHVSTRTVSNTKWSACT